jgi:hypothetical protein
MLAEPVDMIVGARVKSSIVGGAYTAPVLAEEIMEAIVDSSGKGTR